ncbi:hypothetical protein O7632_25095 [Solwaraspora sp. WMMD406]|uniref:hypothetical protein n=1 Tax=Solwaraspora sp. WMMD406 TaxID=3016095 RepID=UPI0024170426|nr:hypothetical protein [Solwaraspora sp. WMMD406]MDG4767342.1 hypothetical protein [Solwaraspora sp. WMMD406]
MDKGWRNALAGVAVLVGLTILVCLPGVVSLAWPVDGPRLTGRLDVGYGVTVDPPADARLAIDSRPGTGDVGIDVGDDVYLALAARRFTGDPQPFVDHALDRLSWDPPGPSAELEQVRLPGSGFTGVRHWTPDPFDDDLGECLTVVTAGTAASRVGVTALVSGVPDCAAVPDAVRRAIDSLSIEESP